MNIWITGVSSGLGRGLAKTYLEQGATVYGLSRRVPEDLIEAGLRHAVVDLKDEDSGRTPLQELLEGTDSLDCVFLNAGKLGEIRDMKDTPVEDLRETMEINVWANKWILDSLFSNVPSIRQVVAISSGASKSGDRGWNGYSLSKAALNMLIKLYAGERPHTHFTSLAPGLVDTAMQDYLTQLPPDERFKPLDVLRQAKGTDQMPDGETCAKKIIQALPLLLQTESGEFSDIRKLKKGLNLSRPKISR